MSAFAINWLSREESLALGWTLLHFCWQGTAVAAIYAIADRLTLRAASGLRYAAAIGALALMPLIVLGTFASEMRFVAVPHAGAASSLTAPTAAIHRAGQALPRYALAIPVSATARGGSWLSNESEKILPLLDEFWMLGVALLALRALGGWRQLARLRKTANEAVPVQLEQNFLRICDRVKVGRRAVLLISDRIISPMAMGVWRATVILPCSAVLSLTPEELEAVLAHELGHIRRWDYACNLLQTALETVLFFHPAVWWLSRQVRERREICCDEIAVQSCSDPVVYAQTLLRLEEQKIAEMQLAVALRGNSGSLLERIEKVLGEDEPMEKRLTGGVRVAVAGAVAIALLFGAKINNAVAASRPFVDHAVALLPQAVAAKVQETPQTAATTLKKEPVENANTELTGVSQPNADTVESTVSESSEGGASEPKPQAGTKAGTTGSSYIDRMSAAGYPLDLNNDLNTLVSLKALGVTPEYASEMGTLGFGKPTVHELMSLKALGVTPEYVAELKQSGLGPKDFHEVTTEKALGITPEYASAMKKSGFDGLNLHELISLKAQNVTPEYVGWLKQQFPQITLDELRRASVFHLDEKFLAQAKSHGFDGKDLDKLLRLKMSGLLDE